MRTTGLGRLAYRAPAPSRIVLKLTAADREAWEGAPPVCDRPATDRSARNPEGPGRGGRSLLRAHPRAAPVT